MKKLTSLLPFLLVVVGCGSQQSDDSTPKPKSSESQPESKAAKSSDGKSEAEVESTKIAAKKIVQQNVSEMVDEFRMQLDGNIKQITENLRSADEFSEPEFAERVEELRRLTQRQALVAKRDFAERAVEIRATINQMIDAAEKESGMEFPEVREEVMHEFDFLIENELSRLDKFIDQQ